MASIETDRRFTLCTIVRNQIVQIEHADDVTEFLPRINAGGSFQIIDRDPEAVGAENRALNGRVIAWFRQANPVYATVGRAAGTARSGNGQFRTNYATRELVAPLDLAGLEAIIARCQAQLREVA